MGDDRLTAFRRRFALRIDQQIVEALVQQNILFAWSGRNRFRDGTVLRGRTHAVVEPYSLFETSDRICTIGAFSYMRSQPQLDMSIGRYCSIGTGLRVLGTTHPVERFTTSPLTYDRGFFDSLGIAPTEQIAELAPNPAVTICDDVWIGQNASLRPGVTIGTGAVVAACALVTKDIPPYEIWGGVPAKRIRPRFPEAIAARLLDSRWWDFHAQTIRNLPMAGPVEAFLDALDACRAAGTGQILPRETRTFYGVVRSIVT